MKKIILALLFLSSAAFAKTDSALVSVAEKYLNSVTGLSGDFSQIANGKRDRGTFDMLRPGRVRLDYNTNKIQLISNGTDLYFVDNGLDQITTVPLNSTPAGILMRKNIDLANADIVVAGTKRDGDKFSLDMHLKEGEGLGKMTVIFDYDPVLLRGWTVVDATGAKTEVSFSGLKTKTDFGKNYFQVQKHRTSSTSGGDSYYE